jgi:TonB family protein
MIPLLLMLAIDTSAQMEPMPASAFASEFVMQINRGPMGMLPAGGCMALAVTLDADGAPRDTAIIRSSRQYPIDRGVLLALKHHRFDPAGLEEGTTWQVFFSWSKDGRRTQLSNTCVDLG